MLSIVIPAHNEQAVIGRCLRALLDGAEPGELEIIVACNGCADRTAEAARRFGHPVRVIEIEQASKTAALNAGDAVASGFPRFYVDADVVIGLDAIRRIADALEQGRLLAATPELRMDLREASWPVRAFYSVWMALPYNNHGGVVGTGVYALSREGRSRFEAFPEIIADDGFVRFTYALHERAGVPGAVSHVEPPRNLRSLIQIKTRSRLGNYELRRRFPAQRYRERRSLRVILKTLAARPSLWACLPVYLAVNVMARWRAARQLTFRKRHVWERDETSRIGRHHAILENSR